jgi:hypothetical protein
MSEREKQIRFMKALMGHETSGECHQIQEKIHRAECEQRALRRIIFLVAVLMLLSLAGLSYATLFWPETSHDRPLLIVKLSCSVALASFICMVGFSGYWLWRRKLLNGIYNECRKLLISTQSQRRARE